MVVDGSCIPIWKVPYYSSPSSSPSRHIRVSLCPSHLFGDVGKLGAGLEPIWNVVDSTPVSYYEWVCFYCSYFNGAEMINVNKKHFRLGKHNGISYQTASAICFMERDLK